MRFGNCKAEDEVLQPQEGACLARGSAERLMQVGGHDAGSARARGQRSQQPRAAAHVQRVHLTGLLLDARHRALYGPLVRLCAA